MNSTKTFAKYLRCFWKMVNLIRSRNLSEFKPLPWLSCWVSFPFSSPVLLFPYSLYWALRKCGNADS